MVFPVHLQRSAVAAILDCPVWRQYTGPETLKPVALQLIGLFQEPRLEKARRDANKKPSQTVTRGVGNAKTPQALLVCKQVDTQLNIKSQGILEEAINFFFKKLSIGGT